MRDTKLRIAVWHNLPSGGGKRALHDHVRGLVARGHHVEAWCPPTADRDFLPLSDVVDEHVIPINVPPPRPIRLLTRLHLRDDTNWRLRAVEDHSRAVANAIGDRFDVVLASTCQLTAVPPIGSHVTVPTVLYLQEPNRRLYEALPRLPWLDRRGAARRAVRQAQAELANIRDYTRVLVNSYFSREGVLRAFGVDSHVSYLGVDTERFRPLADGARDYVIGVGAFTPPKNIELVLRALARIGPHPPPLTWIGNHTHSPSYVDELHRLADDLGVTFRSKVLVDDAELVEVLGAARLLVYSPRLEPFGFGPLEANACGVPVVGGAEGGVRETVIDGVNGLLVEPDVASLADGVATLWHDPARAAALGAAGREHVARAWTTDASVARLETHLLEAAR